MILIKVLCWLAVIFGFFLVVLGYWGVHEYHIFQNKKKRVYPIGEGNQAKDFVLSFCVYCHCSINRMPKYCAFFVFAGMVIMVGVGYSLFKF